MEYKVSVIVPVYNAEQYLARCLGNLLNQTLTEIEVILVNDCSTDRSLQIMQAAQQQFPEKVKIIDLKENRGPGNARNLGIESAKGEYIGFVDSDDCVDVHMYEKLYMEAKKQDCDIVDSGFYFEKEQQAYLYTSDELCGALNGDKRSQLIVSGGYLVSKIFRKALIFDNNCRFRPEYVLEDADILTYLFSVADSIANVKEVLYQYTSTEDSLSSTKDWKRYCDSILSAMQGIADREMSLPKYKEIRQAVEYQQTQMYVYAVIMALSDMKQQGKCDEEHLQKLQELANMRKKYVTAGYDNPYIREKIEQDDLAIAEANDYDPQQLVGLVLGMNSGNGK